MKERRTRKLEDRAARGSFASFASIAFTFLQAIVQVPLLLHFWAASEYGLWVGLVAATGFITSLDLGHQNFVGNELAQLWGSNQERLQTTLASGVQVACVLGLIELLLGVGIALSGRLHLLIGANVPMGANADVTWALALYLFFWALCGAVGGLLVRLYPPAGLYERSQWLGIASRVLGFGALIGSVYFGASLFSAMVAQVIAWTCFNVYLAYDIYRHVPSVFPWWRGGSFIVGWRNFRISLLLTGNGILDQSTSNGLVLIVAAATSPIQVVALTTIRTLTNVAIQGTSTMLNPLAPDMARYHGRKEGTKIRAIFSTSWFFGNSLLTTAMVIGLIFVEPVFEKWTHGSVAFDRVLFGLLAAGVVIRNWSAALQAYLASTNSLKAQLCVTTVRAVACLGITIAFIGKGGLIAVGWAIVIAEIASAFVAWIATRRLLASMSSQMPKRDAMLAIGQVGFALLALIVYAANVSWTITVAAPVTFLIVAIAVLQWRGLGPDIQHRFVGLIKRQLGIQTNDAPVRIGS